MSTPRILAFAGSARKASFNKCVVAVAAGAAERAGAEVTLLDLGDYPLPIMDEDVEARDGLPANARKLKDLFLSHDGLLIGCPEYNSSITPLLKNLIDWVSRPCEGESPLGCYDDKVAGLVAASPGGLGGLRGLRDVRSILSSIKVLVIPEQAAVGNAHSVLEGGTIKDEKVLAMVEGVGERLAHCCGAMMGG